VGNETGAGLEDQKDLPSKMFLVGGFNPSEKY